MAEVEAQLVRADVGAGLAHVAAEALAQRRLQQVRRRVVGLRRVARAMVDRREHLLAGLELALLDHDRERLIVAQAEHLLHARAAVAVLAFDRADVGHLAAAGRVEGRLGELHQKAAVVRLERAHGRVLALVS